MADPAPNEGLYACPLTGEPLDPATWTSTSGRTYPTCDGIPVLTAVPPRWLPEFESTADSNRGLPQLLVSEQGLRAPDGITPHLPPAALGAPGFFGAWLRQLKGKLPQDVVVGWGKQHAGPGPCLNIGCGAGEMVRRMAATGREVYACDGSGQAVLMARDTLTGRLGQATLPTHRGGYRWMPFPHPPLPEDQLHFCIAELELLPYRPASFDWIHFGQLCPIDGLFKPLESAMRLLRPGGLLTLSTAYDMEPAPILDSPGPEEELHDALARLGLVVLEEQEAIPDVVREYDRAYRVLFTHCLAARRVDTELEISSAS